MPLTLENVSYIYGAHTPFEIQALNDLSVTFENDTVTGLMGHTGSGKSTAAQMLNGLIKPTTGRVLLDGEDINKNKKTCYEAKFKVGLVFQYPEYQLFKDTLRQDIAYGPKNMKLSEEEIKLRVEEACEFVGLSKSLLDKSPFELSGGQKRRAAIAGIIAMKPRFLVLDEPAAGLDPAGRDDILSKICSYRQNGKNSVILISHSMEDKAKYCDTVVVMDNGKTCMTGNAEQIFEHYRQLKEIGLNTPQITRFMTKLYDEGYDVSKSVYTVESAAKEIISLYNRLKKEKND